MEKHSGQGAGYHDPAVAARRAEQKHAEVERRYAWAQQEASKRQCSPSLLMAINRVREIRRLFEHRYGDSLPNDKAGRVGLALLVNYVVQVNRSDPIGAAAREARAWAAWLSEADARRMAEHAVARPIKLKADTIAERLGVTNDLRVALRFTTIGACDVTRAERDKAKRKRHAAHERDRRRCKGAVPKAQYRANAEALRAEAAALNIKPETLRKRRQRAAKACPKSALSQVRADRKRFNGAHALGTPSLAAPQQMAQRELVRFVLSTLSASSRASPISDTSRVRAASYRTPIPPRTKPACGTERSR